MTSPALLVAYCDTPAPIAQDFGLFTADEGANVALLRPFDEPEWRADSLAARSDAR